VQKLISDRERPGKEEKNREQKLNEEGAARKYLSVFEAKEEGLVHEGEPWLLFVVAPVVEIPGVVGKLAIALLAGAQLV
jgi:hypothetical protein